MVVNNPNNWHWVDKNCLNWSKEYFQNNLVGLIGENETSSVKIVDVSSVEGDVDVSQRKGKVISLFDLKIVLSYKGSNEKDKNITGSITIPELAYDSEESDLVFDISVYNENSDNSSINSLIKQKLIPQLREKLVKFGPDLIETNVKDIQIEQDKVTSTYTKGNLAQPKQTNDNKKEVAKPSTSSTSSISSNAAKATESSNNSSNIPKYNTTTLHLEPSFNTTAEQIYITLLDESRIAAWTRSYPIIEKFPPKEGSTYKFFGGAVSGKFLKLVPNEQIIESWRLEDWKQGHYAELNLKLVQSSGETKLVVKFSGIPIGEEERVRDNFEDMYIKAIKITFGFGAVL
ncbi:AHA1 [Candida pseudojiufengensis]|uniref:AHA1 n=1 Tax=Candida pseudojiufengensis TaxID=497109 RepID=UPI0022245556|nr:AHA1 [Candida pseudojiufengensis]KAI5961881.1 AHA1 [Candida pseudojiufengensis]